MQLALLLMPCAGEAAGTRKGARWLEAHADDGGGGRAVDCAERWEVFGEGFGEGLEVFFEVGEVGLGEGAPCDGIGGVGGGADGFDGFAGLAIGADGGVEVGAEDAVLAGDGGGFFRG